MLKTNDIYKIHEHLFSAAAGEIPFSTALETLVNAFDGAGGVVFELNRKSGVISNWIGPGLESSANEYVNHLNTINPRMHYSMRHAAGHIAYEGKFIDERNMDGHEFYDAIQSTAGVQYFLGSRIFDENNISLFHSVEFTRQHGHPDKEKIDQFKRIAPAIGNAWRLAGRAAPSAPQNGSGPWTPDHLPWSIFALSSSGAIVEMNTAARKMLDRNDVIHLQDGVLEALDKASSTKFKKAMQLGIKGETSETLLYTGETNAPFVAQIIPVNVANISTPQPISILIYICNPAERSQKINGALARLYGFTPAETRLAAVLTNGCGLITASRQLGISRNTARNQLQKMFIKTGSHNQSEFLVLILGVFEN